MATTILVVDDERSVLAALRRSLVRFGFTVLLEESAEEALELLQRRGAAGGEGLPQVVLSDQRLTRMDGLTFLTEVRARWPPIQRVLITGFANLDGMERAINEAGVYRFLTKPWEDVTLLGTVRSAVEQWQTLEDNRRLLEELSGHNRRLEEAVAARTRELMQAARELSLADRLAAIGQLAGGVAHQINNPLSGILASAQLLLRGPEGPPQERQEFLQEIESAALRCKKIVEHLLRFSRQARRDAVEPVNLNLLVREAMPIIEDQYALRGVHLRYHLSPDLPDVLGSAGRLQQVLLNLLSNAFDATIRRRQGQGQGQPGAGAARPKPGLIEVRTAHAGGQVLLEVRDQGPGIEEAHLPRLFSPFFTTKPEGQGRGLSLAAAYGIVADHDGTICARNHPEGGAEFVVRLPVHPRPGPGDDPR